MISYRLAEPEDFDAMLPMFAEFHAENGVAPLDIGVLEQNILSCTSRGMVYIAEDEGQVIGAIALVAPQWFYSTLNFIVDLCFYVLPQYRAAPGRRSAEGPVGAELLRWAASVSEHADLPIYIRVNNPGKMRGRVAMIEGFVPVGYVTRLKKRGS